MFSKSIAIVEAGASHVAFGLFHAGRGGCPRLAQFATESFVLDPECEGDWLRMIAAGLQALRSRVNRPGPVVVTLPAHLVLSKFLNIPRVDAAQRDKIIRFEAQQNVPYALGDVVWATAPLGETATGCAVLLCAAKLDALDPFCAVVAAAGFEPRHLLPSPLATLAASCLAGVPAGTLSVNLGARSTTLLLAAGNRTHLRSFPLGGNSVTQQIMQVRGCDFAAAEELKLSGKDPTVVGPAAAAFAGRLTLEINRSVLHFQKQSAVEGPGRILITGGGAQLSDLPALLARRLNLSVERFVPGNLVDSDGASVDSFGSTDMIGAAALHLGNGQPSMDLLPPRLRARAERRRRQPWLAAAAAVAVAALVPPVVHFQEIVAAARRESVGADQQLVPLRERVARNRDTLTRLELVRRQIDGWQDIQQRRTAWLSLFADFQDRLIEVGDVWLERWQVMPFASGPGHPSGPVPAGAPPALRIAVSGRMLDKANPRSKVSDDTYRRVKGLLASIGGSPFVAGVEDEAFDYSQPGVLRFSFVFVVNAAHPL